jgi:hypothetical protein
MPPPFWQFLTRRWLGLSPDLAYTWWNALSRSRWSAPRTFHQAVLRYDQHPAPGQRPLEEKLSMSGLVEPQALMQLVEDLVAEGVLLRRDSIKLEEALLGALDATGAWCVEERRDL